MIDARCPTKGCGAYADQPHEDWCPVAIQKWKAERGNVDRNSTVIIALLVLAEIAFVVWAWGA